MPRLATPTLVLLLITGGLLGCSSDDKEATPDVIIDMTQGDESIECVEDDACEDETVCEENACVRLSCSERADCGDDDAKRACKLDEDGDGGVCVPQACVKDSDCDRSIGEVCIDFLCGEPLCVNDDSCNPGEVCNLTTGLCQPEQ